MSEIVLSELLELLVARWRRIAVVGCMGALTGWSYASLRPLRYDSAAVVAANSSESAVARIGGLGAALGLSGALGGNSLSVLTLGELAQGEGVTAQVVRAPSGKDGRSIGSFLLEKDAPDESELARLARRLPSDFCKYAPNQRGGTLRVSCRAEDPVVAQALVAMTLDRLNRQLADARKAGARLEREFFEGRYTESLRELESREQELARFQVRNRSFENAPAKLLEQQQLERRLRLSAQVFEEVLQALEDFRTREVRDSPSLSVLEQPQVALLPAPRGRLRSALLLGLGTAAAYCALLATALSQGLTENRRPAASLARFRSLLAWVGR